MEAILKIVDRICAYAIFDPKFSIPNGFWRDINALQDAYNNYQQQKEKE